MPIPERWRRLMPRLAVESLVVVFSILLALVVNEWRQEAEREERRGRALDAIRAELLHNHRELRRVHGYHRGLADTLLKLSGSGVRSVDSSVRPRGWTLQVELLSAAWAAARSTGTTAQFDYPILLALSRAYEKQSGLVRRREDLASVVLGGAFARQSASLLDNPGGMAGVLNSISGWEAQLLREYERALSALGVPPDSLGEAG